MIVDNANTEVVLCQLQLCFCSPWWVDNCKTRQNLAIFQRLWCKICHYSTIVKDRGLLNKELFLLPVVYLYLHLLFSLVTSCWEDLKREIGVIGLQLEQPQKVSSMSIPSKGIVTRICSCGSFAKHLNRFKHSLHVILSQASNSNLHKSQFNFFLEI